MKSVDSQDTVRLKLASAVLRQAGGGRYYSDVCLMVISVHVPTFKASRHVKEAS